jgi:hypothetical protein
MESSSAHDRGANRSGTELSSLEPGDWAGADLVSDWFRRNMRIYNNVVRLVDSPDDRVLVIFSAGHLGGKQHNFATDPTFRLRKLAEFAN